MRALSHSGGARSSSCGWVQPTSTLCACHAGSVSTDTQGLDMQVTKSQAMGIGFGGEVHMARISHKSQDWKPRLETTAYGDGTRSVLL